MGAHYETREYPRKRLQSLRRAKVPYVPATGPSSSLAFAGNIDDLSDSSLVQLMADMSQFDALPATEPEPVFAMDGGEGQ